MTIAIVFVILAPFSKQIFSFVATPLMKHLPEQSSMIATQVASPFLTPFKLTLMVAIFVSMPMVLYQLWAFVAPGLYRREKKFALPLVGTSILLFYMGVAFAYYVVFPLVFAFLTSVAPEGVTVMTDINHYLDFIIALFFAFGLAFEVPIATVLLVWTGFVTPENLGSKRPYIFLGAFVVGMLLTPPDVISQTLLALPVYILYEVGIIMSRFFASNKESATTEQSETQT
jgi:sec-independent protein translocase protein TatC